MSVRALHSSVQLPAVALVLAVGACAIEEPSTEPSTESTTQAIGVGCSIIVCNENAPTAGDGLLFDELDLFGRQNYAGTAMLGAHLDSGSPTAPIGPAVRIMIFGDELWAYDSAAARWYTGTALIHTIIDFVNVPTGVNFQIRIEDYSPQSVMFMAGPREPVPTYLLKARRSPTEQFTFNVCSDSALVPDPTWTGLDHYALVYRGDRYDPGRKRLLPNNVGDGWSFIACNRSAASKMHLWRHTYAGAFNDAGAAVYMTTLEQRTALLKAITADYCGTGIPEFTVTGTALAWATAMEPSAFPFPWTVPMASIEALWGPNGPYCLDHPRRERFGMTRAEVVRKCGRSFDPCGPPGATTPPPGWWNTRYAVTANPLPPPLTLPPFPLPPPFP